MNNKKHIEFRPIAYVGFVMSLSGILGPRLIGTNNELIDWVGIIMFIVGLSFSNFRLGNCIIYFQKKLIN